MISYNGILLILKEASSRLPQLRFAWGLLGLSAIAALIIKLLGESKASIIVIGLTIIGFVIVFVASIAFRKKAIAKLPAQLLIWSITIFFVIFLVFTVTGIATSWPCNWVRFLSIEASECSSKPNPIIPGPSHPEILNEKFNNIYY